MSTSTAAPLSKIKRDQGKVFFTIGIVLIVTYCLTPFCWMLVSSLRPDSEVFEDSWWLRHPPLENYRVVFSEENDFANSLISSLVASITVTIVVLAVVTLIACTLVRPDLRGKRVLMLLVIATSMFPLVAIIVPLLKNFAVWGWTDTYQVMIALDLSPSLPLVVWNLMSFFRQMLQEPKQPAMVDGYTSGQALREVILPLATPGIFTAAIVILIDARNEFFVAVTMIVNLSMQSAMVFLSKFTGDSQLNTPFDSQMAAGAIMALPLVIMILLFQRRIVAGLTTGGLKQ